MTSKTEIRMSPMTRLYAAFDLELGIDKSGTLANLKGRYIERLGIAETKRDALFRSMFIIDSILVILLTGKALAIPFIGIKTSDLPAILEIITATSAIATVFTVTAFINWAAYDTIVNQYAIREANIDHIDPDFIQAADKQTELMLKLFRVKFNTWGADFHEPGKGMILFSRIMHFMVYSLFILFPVMHWLLTAYSLRETVTAHSLSLLTYIYMIIVILLNILSVMIFAGTYREFKFYADFGEQDKTVT